MTVRAPDPLPPETRHLLETDGPMQAGEHLLRRVEHLARSQPGKARSWGRDLARVHLDDKVMTACARWAGGAALYLGGEVAAAEPTLRDAAQRFSAAGDPAAADRVRLLLVDLHGERFELGRARRLARRLDRNFRNRGDRERAAAALLNLACAEDAADHVATARNLWRRARRDLAPGSLRRLAADANLAGVAAMEGRFTEAADELRRVADEARASGLDAFALQAELNLAEVEFSSGRADAALARWQTIIEQARATGHGAVELTAVIDLAQAELTLGDTAGARRRVEPVLDTARDLGLERELVRALCLLATVDAAEGSSDGWRRTMTELRGRHHGVQRDLLLVDVAQLDPSCDPGAACRAARRLLRSGHTHRGRLGLAWAARRALDRGRRRRARELAREALQGRGASPWTRMVAHHVLGRAGGSRSVSHLARAARSADLVHGRLAAAADRQAFLALRSDVYLDYLGALLERNRTQDRRRALGIAGRLRAGWLLDELARRTEDGDDESVRRWHHLRSRLAALLHEVEGGDEPRLRRSGLRLHGTIRRLESDLRRAEMELARRLPIPGRHDASDTVDELIRKLPPDDAFVEYLLHRGDLVVFHARAGRLNVHRLEGRAAVVEELLDSVQFHLDAQTWLGGTATARQLAALEDRLSRLSDMLFDAIPMSGISRLWVAPHAGLVQVPWAALPVESGDSLVDRLQLTLLPGAEAAALLLREPARAPRTAALGGAPSSTLPMVEQEISDLAALVPSATVAATTTRDEFLTLLETHELVHLAGHAVFLDGLPFASGLRMSDAYVTVRDLAATRLAARFVSFGVCSGLRLGREHGDRHAGFVLALLSGGVRTVIGPIAPVRDEVAYAFDLELHTTLSKTSNPSAAFSNAVKTVRDLDPRPAVWGAFHMYGDPRSWEN